MTFLMLPFVLTASELPVEISLPASPKPCERKAASELSAYLMRMGVKSVSMNGRSCSSIYVGDTAFAREHGLSAGSLGNEQWVVKSFGPQLVLVGGGTRGTLYAVSHFLEDCCGVRWWSQIEEDVPTRETLALDELDLGGTPAFPERDVYAAVSETNASEIACRLRLNGVYSGDGKDADAFGGWVRVGSPTHCHTLERYIPAKEYLATHPEWFSYDRKEKRRRGGDRDGQLCWTNPEVRAQMKKRLRAYIDADREKAAKEDVPPPTVYEISENDNTHYCECADCWTAREKWNLSGLNLDFVNDIASSIEEDYPGVFVRTFAYEGTEDPPKGGKHAVDNVIVRLCNTKSNRVAGLHEKGNTTFADFLSAWSKSAKNLAIWDYSITFTKNHCGFPLPSELHYGEYFRLCRDMGVRTFFWEHELPWKADMWELKWFLETKLMEDPSLNDVALIAQFMREYYGPAGEDIAAYRRRLDAVRRAKNGCVKWFPQLADFDWIGTDDIAAFQKDLESAEVATGGSEPWLSRVRRARLGVDRLLCQRERAATGEITSSEGRAAEARIRAFWPKWAARYRSVPASAVTDAIANELGLPKPAKFANENIADFPASSFNLMATDGSMRLVDDPKSETGRAVLFDGAKRQDNACPFDIGMYDRKAERSLMTTTLKRAAGEEYAWYRVGEAEVPKNGHIWMTKSWLANLSFKGRTELHGRRVECWASVRFEMSKGGGKGQPACISTFIDRIVLKKLDNKENPK